MNPGFANRPFAGITVPLVTPLTSDGGLDESSLVRLIEYVLAGGVQTVFVLGTTGEGAGLDEPVAHKLVERAAKLIAGRVPLLVGITDTVLARSLRHADHAARSGAAAVVAAPPYYFPVAQEELAAYVEQLAAALALPLLLYNIPSCTTISFSPETVAQCGRLPGVIGIKDSSGDPAYLREVRRLLGDRPDFSLLVGAEEMLAEGLLAGYDGGICGGANYYPRLYVELYQAAQRGDHQRLSELQAKVSLVIRTMYDLDNPDPRVIATTKCATQVLGLCQEYMAPPLEPLRSDSRAAVQRCLAEFGLL